MAFLANPCACGYSMDETIEDKRWECRACLRVYERFEGVGRVQQNNKNDLRDPELCNHKRSRHLEWCRHCILDVTYLLYKDKIFKKVR